MDNLIDHAALIGGVLAAALAALAWIGDRRRLRRTDPDAVGFMPWTTVFFWALLLAVLLLGAALKSWLAGGA